MTTTAVVKHFDIFEQIGLRVLMRPVARGVNPFVLQAVEEAFRRGIVPTISLATHRAAHAVDVANNPEYAGRLSKLIEGVKRMVNHEEADILAKQHQQARIAELGGPENLVKLCQGFV